jgi:hypothetical protein
VFDEAEGLFGSRHAGEQGSTARYANMDVGLLLHHLERFPGALVLITNTIDNIDKVRRQKLGSPIVLVPVPVSVSVSVPIPPHSLI